MVLVPQEKVTITLPTQIKEEVVKLKDEMKISMNSIYQIAIQEYVKKKNREKLRLEASQMVEEYKTNPDMTELSNLRRILLNTKRSSQDSIRFIVRVNFQAIKRFSILIIFS